MAFIHEIPEKNELIRISGKFYFADYYSKSGNHPVEMVNEAGDRVVCNCENFGRFNCLDKISFKNESIVSNVDKKYEAKYGLNRAVLKWLGGKDGEILVHPQRGLLWDTNTCYQISFGDQIIKGYDQYSVEYQKFKKSFDTAVVVVLHLICALVFIIYLVCRTYKFIKSEKM